MRGQKKFLKVKTTKTKTLNGETVYKTASTDKARVGKDRYTTAEEASERAEAIGCSGYHTHTEDGETVYMPCENMGVYESTVGEGYSASTESEKVAKVPSYIQKNARRGLDLLEFAGDGLTQKTIREARSMANGKVSDDKAKRMAAWFARHKSDLDSPRADAYLNGDSENPTAGQVAWLLWGGDLGKNKMRAMEWAERQADDKSASCVEDVTTPPAKMEDIAMRIAEGQISLGKSRSVSFMKRCVISTQDEGKSKKRFSTRMDIAASPSEAVYEGNRIIDYQNVTFKGYASTNEDTTKEDRIGDYLRRGAFRKTIKEFKKNPVMLIDHENSVKNIAGSYANMVEDDTGLFVEGVISNAPELATVRILIAEGHLKTLSIGGMFYYEDDGKAISEVDLMEVSLVAIPMNPDARFEAV